MLTQQIIRFELPGLGPVVVQVLLKLVIFYDKTKINKQTFEWIIIYC